jgi:GT2 family glycosyltransferase
MSALDQVTLVSVTYESEGVAEGLGQTLARFPHSIVVDNASGDATIARLRAASPTTQVVHLSRNRGYGYANNRGVEAARTKYALLLNPDCTIEPEAVEALVECAETFPRAVGVAPHTFDEEGRPEVPYHAGFLWPKKGPILPLAEGPVSARVITGACMLLNIENFRCIGMYDENLFMYYEEQDLGLRATRAGFDMISTPAARAVHMGSASSPSTWHIRFVRNFHVTRSKLVMLAKYVGPHAARRLRWRLVAAGPLAVLLGVLSLRREAVVKWLARFWAAVKG